MNVYPFFQVLLYRFPASWLWVSHSAGMRREKNHQVLRITPGQIIYSQFITTAWTAAGEPRR